MSLRSYHNAWFEHEAWVRKHMPHLLWLYQSGLSIDFIQSLYDRRKKA